MLNYAEEQENELQALEAIYPSELTVISRAPNGRFQITVQCEDTSEEQDEEEFSLSIRFEFTNKYPDEQPIIEIMETSDSLDEEDESELLERLTEEANQSLGMVMIFTLMSTAQEWMNLRKDNADQKRADETTKKLRAVEEAEQKRFEGTRVTVDTFMKWKISFDKEMAALNSHKDKIADTTKMSKLSGRQLFEKDSRLNDSDLQFLEEGDVAADIEHVKVDESLFEDLDDLDIEDDDE